MILAVSPTQPDRHDGHSARGPPSLPGRLRDAVPGRPVVRSVPRGAAVARRVPLRVRGHAGVAPRVEAAGVPVRELPAAELGHRGHGDAQGHGAAGRVVLGRLGVFSGQGRGVRAPALAGARAAVRDRLALAPQGARRARREPGSFPREGVVEVDETCTGGETSKGKGGRSLSDPRRGVVVLAVVRKRVETGNPGFRGTGMRCGDTRMAVVESAGARDLLGFLKSVCARHDRRHRWGVQLRASVRGGLRSRPARRGSCRERERAVPRADVEGRHPSLRPRRPSLTPSVSSAPSVVDLPDVDAHGAAAPRRRTWVRPHRTWRLHRPERRSHGSCQDVSSGEPLRRKRCVRLRRSTPPPRMACRPVSLLVPSARTGSRLEVTSFAPPIPTCLAPP